MDALAGNDLFEAIDERSDRHDYRRRSVERSFVRILVATSAPGLLGRPSGQLPRFDAACGPMRRIQAGPTQVLQAIAFLASGVKRYDSDGTRNPFTPDSRYAVTMFTGSAQPRPHANPIELRANILGVLVSITDYARLTEQVVQAARGGHSFLVACSDVHAIMQARIDQRFAALLNSFDAVTPDGQPVRWGMRWTGQASLKDRVYGPALMLRVCEAAADRGCGVFLYGSRAETLDRLGAALLRKFPTLDIRGALPGRFRPLSVDEQESDAAAIRSSGASILFVGMGCPRQEWWMFHMRQRLKMPMLAVGAAFDFHSGTVRQAPKFMQRHGLEWLYRFSREPNRLARRYLVVTPQYLPLIAMQALGLRNYPVPLDLADAANVPCPG